MSTLKMPIPISYNGSLLVDVNIKSYTAGVIADCKKSLDAQGPYAGYQTFLSGCIESIGEVISKQEIRNIINNMSYKTAEYLMLEIIALDGEDGIEGMYICPRCNNEIICEHDTEDHIKDLEIKTTECVNFEIKLLNGITIENKMPEDSIEYVQSLTFRYPTLKDCLNAYIKYGKKEQSRLQLGICLEGLNSVNGIDIDLKFKNRYGMQIIENLVSKDLKFLIEKINEFGVITDKIKTCNKCGKEFKVNLNTSNFFVSALQ
jgi:hypothetical protein